MSSSSEFQFVPDNGIGNASVVDQWLVGDVLEWNSNATAIGGDNVTISGNVSVSGGLFPPSYPTTTTTSSATTTTLAYLLDTGRVQIPLYSVIFLLAVIGNSLVILTLVQNKRMRTITNLFLLNLAVSDLFLGVFCMPFTLVGTLLRDFVFGEVMCKLLPYLQGECELLVIALLISGFFEEIQLYYCNDVGLRSNFSS